MNDTIFNQAPQVRYKKDEQGQGLICYLNYDQDGNLIGEKCTPENLVTFDRGFGG